MYDITNRTSIQLGFLPTHAGFVAALVPGDEGRLPRNADGELAVLAAIEAVQKRSRVALDCVQVSIFPGTADEDLAALVEGLRVLDLQLYFVLMVGGVDPMNPADEQAFADQILPTIELAKQHGGSFVASTSIEAWMVEGDEPRQGAALEAAVEQNVQAHARIYREAGLADSPLRAWHIEFLRPGEFQTFTNVERAWSLIRAMNRDFDTPFFKLLIDTAHCGDSSLSLEENQALIARIAEAGHFGSFHASAPTTRGCLSTDDGWIGALLTACARTGCLTHVFVEAFRHDDPALAGLRALDPGHGIDTTDGRTYNELVADGIADIARRLNNLKARRILA